MAFALSYVTLAVWCCCVAERRRIEGVYTKLKDGDQILTYHTDVLTQQVLDGTENTIEKVMTPVSENMSEMKMQDIKTQNLIVLMHWDLHKSLKSPTHMFSFHKRIHDQTQNLIVLMH